ncbi:hypothetical protein [Pedobacter sp. SYSU D00535]|uniref:hypothetical protein n=1 Tax=Pedobacter sp. SYSU D00535 TaxID=2810308 RepID=UPI001A961587|nr:hypothetical protein [Pedobacter sp. SYSU D00535]
MQIGQINRADARQLLFLKRGVWLYFFLLIFEGALRKWILPGLATPLLIVRDPLALWLLVKSAELGVFVPNFSVKTVWVTSVVAFFAALFFGHGNLTVALYGLRILILHFPLMFVIGQVFNREDAIELGVVLLWINIGMTLLVAVQFFSPQTAWVNRGVGGDAEGSGFFGTSDYYRVPGTFSFTNGLSIFYGLVASYVFYFWMDLKNEKLKKWVLIASTISLLAAIPLSISRTVLFEILLSFAFLCAIVVTKPQILGRIVLALAGIFLILAVLSNFDFFRTSSSAFTERFTNANESEGGVEGVFVDRFLGGMLAALSNDAAPSFWGYGLGMGTNAGAKLMTGTRTFLISEGEWGRLIGEMGLYLGLIIILVRLFFITEVFSKSWRAVRVRNYLPWLLLSFGLILILQGQWAQPTALGFSTLAGGLILASLNYRDKKSE